MGSLLQTKAAHIDRIIDQILPGVRQQAQAIVSRLLCGSVRIAESERDYLHGLTEDRDREELGPPEWSYSGLGQPPAFRSRGPRRSATMIAQGDARRVRVPVSGLLQWGAAALVARTDLVVGTE